MTYIEVEDDQGRRARLVAHVMMRLTCSQSSCEAVLWVEWPNSATSTTYGTPGRCVACGSTLVRCWGRGQRVFVPEGQAEAEDQHLRRVRLIDTDDNIGEGDE